MKEEEALVRAVRVVRGSRFSTGVSAVDSIRFRGVRGEGSVKNLSHIY